MRNEYAVDGEWKCHRPVAATIYRVAWHAGMGCDLVGPAITPAIFGYIAASGYCKDIGRYHYGPEAQYAEDDEYHIHDWSLSHSQQLRISQCLCKIHADFLNAYYTSACSMLALLADRNNQEVYKLLTHLGQQVLLSGHPYRTERLPQC